MSSTTSPTAPSTTIAVAPTTAAASTTTRLLPPPTVGSTVVLPQTTAAAQDAASPTTVAGLTPEQMLEAQALFGLLQQVCTAIEPSQLAQFYAVNGDFFPEVEPTVGPDPGDTPPPLGSADPALDIRKMDLIDDACGDGMYSGVVVELGGPPDAVQLSLGLDTVAGEGRPANPDAPGGLGRIGGWDQFLSVEPDGTTFFADAQFDALEGPVQFVRNGNLCALLVPRLTSGELTYHLMTFRRDGNTAESPVDWQVATAAATIP